MITIMRKVIRILVKLGLLWVLLSPIWYGYWFFTSPRACIKITIETLLFLGFVVAPFLAVGFFVFLVLRLVYSILKEIFVWKG